RLRPIAVQFRLAQRLLLPGGDALFEGGKPRQIVASQIERPRSDDRLKKNGEVPGGWYAPIVSCRPNAFTTPDPALHMLRPFDRRLTETRQPGSHVLAAFVVVRRGREQGARETLLPRRRMAMEIGSRTGEAPRIETDIVAREQPAKTIERGIFNSFGGQR